MENSKFINVQGFDINIDEIRFIQPIDELSFNIRLKGNDTIHISTGIELNKYWVNFKSPKFKDINYVENIYDDEIKEKIHDEFYDLIYSKISFLRFQLSCCVRETEKFSSENWFNIDKNEIIDKINNIYEKYNTKTE